MTFIFHSIQNKNIIGLQLINSDLFLSNVQTLIFKNKFHFRPLLRTRLPNCLFDNLSIPSFPFLDIEKVKLHFEITYTF